MRETDRSSYPLEWFIYIAFLEEAYYELIRKCEVMINAYKVFSKTWM